MAESRTTAGKRVRSTSNTPRQYSKRKVTSRSEASFSELKKKLFATAKRSPITWSVQEEKALVDFVAKKSPSIWPVSMKEEFWKHAAEYVFEYCGTNRTSGGCRSRVKMKLREKYLTPEKAKDDYATVTVNRVSGSSVDHQVSSSIAGSSSEHQQEYDNEEQIDDVHTCISEEMSPEPASQYSSSLIQHGESATQQEHSYSPKSIEVEDTVLSNMFSNLEVLPADEQLRVIGEMFCSYAANHYSLVVPSEYLALSLQGMKHLEVAGKRNVLYQLAKGLGNMRPDGSDSLFPTLRMPMGLLQYMVDFFNSTPGQTIICSDDYRNWMQTMYVLFGNKFSKIYLGPMWSKDPTGQDSDVLDTTKDPLKARVNVPGLGERTIQRDIVSTDFSNSSAIQIATLNEAHKVHPNVKWWLKGDGCDVVSGLEESVRLEWNGDVDMGDGDLQRVYSIYCNRLKQLDVLLCNVFIREDRGVVLDFMGQEQNRLTTDITFITIALKKANDDYSAKLASGSATEKTLLDLSWKLDDLSRLSQSGREISVELATLIDILEDDSADLVVRNAARHLTQLKENLYNFVKGLYRNKRTAATHIFVVMISTEARSKKPYALPVQCFSYTGMSIQKIRFILNQIITAMIERNMDVNGFASNGEHNSMRVKGYTRPVSIFQIKADARKKYSKMGKKSMINMLTPIKLADGRLIAAKENRAVTPDILVKIMQWKQSGANSLDILKRLRLQMVPTGFTTHPWSMGKEEEDQLDLLRSILAQLEYSYRVRLWDSKGVPFCTYIYVPEIHPITKQEFHEREDFAHVFKRIAQCTRLGGPKQLKLERFTEALYDESSGMTYPALTGQRKQSVQDAEILFSEGVQLFMEKKNYEYEVKYIKAVRNWRRACDERGLSSLQRCRFNYELLQLMLDELMPWHNEQYDFSLMEANREMNILGFTREVIIAVTTNIESMEWKRRESIKKELKVEHPRSSTTDDVECMFSIMRDLTGKHFTLREARYTWRKVCIEFAKRLNPDIGYYYFTSSHDRFCEGDRPHFDEKPTKVIKRQKVRRREQPANLMFGRMAISTPSARSTRMTFHNIPLELPPVPNSESHVYEHSYAKK